MKRKIFLQSMENIWGTDLADKQISKYDKSVCWIFVACF